VNRYDNENNIHHNRFRYVESDTEHDLEPDSDIAINDFQRATKEWEARKKLDGPERKGRSCTDVSSPSFLLSRL
jgi:hypothetical protein